MSILFYRNHKQEFILLQVTQLVHITLILEEEVTTYASIANQSWGGTKTDFSLMVTYMAHNMRYFQTNPFSKSRQALSYNDAPCAACYTPKSATIMIPARKTCPRGWRKEYGGYVMAGAFFHQRRNTYVCVDGDPEAREEGGANAGALFFNTEAACGALPCPPFVSGREITCVVCSK